MIIFYDYCNKPGLDRDDIEKGFNELKKFKSRVRIPVIEHIFKQNARDAFFYAWRILNDRWLEAEPIILQDSYASYWYAKDIIKGRWLEAEPTIMKSTVHYGWYVTDFNLMPYV
jgi:hypothetical protein